jgi:hypothetical protein
MEQKKLALSQREKLIIEDLIKLTIIQHDKLISSRLASLFCTPVWYQAKQGNEFRHGNTIRKTG